MHDALARGEPLHVAGTEARSGAERVGVIDVAAPHDRDGLETAMRMLREARDDVAVVHPPAVLLLEVLTDVAATERLGRRTELIVSGGIGVVVVNAEQERICGLPRKAQGAHREDRVVGRHPSECSSGSLARACELAEAPSGARAAPADELAVWRSGLVCETLLARVGELDLDPGLSNAGDEDLAELLVGQALPQLEVTVGVVRHRSLGGA